MFNLSLVAGVMAVKLVLTTTRNWLAKNDYSFSIDDWCDIGIAACILV